MNAIVTVQIPNADLAVGKFIEFIARAMTAEGRMIATAIAVASPLPPSPLMRICNRAGEMAATTWHNLEGSRALLALGAGGVRVRGLGIIREDCRSKIKTRAIVGPRSEQNGGMLRGK